jgi:hypothetical protein
MASGQQQSLTAPSGNLLSVSQAHSPSTAVSADTSAEVRSPGLLYPAGNLFSKTVTPAASPPDFAIGLSANSESGDGGRIWPNSVTSQPTRRNVPVIFPASSAASCASFTYSTCALQSANYRDRFFAGPGRYENNCDCLANEADNDHPKPHQL